MLFDTDIFIWIQKGNAAAADAVEAAGANSRASMITYMEFLQGSSDKRTLKTNMDFFKAALITLLPVTPEISFRAAHYVERYCLAHHMHANDALIAATAVEHGLPLMTGNGKHYRHLKELDLVVLRTA